MMERRVHHSLYEVLWQDRYTPAEAAELLQIGIDVLRHAAFKGGPCCQRSTRKPRPAAACLEVRP
jgi:hypothetical protein